MKPILACILVLAAGCGRPTDPVTTASESTASPNVQTASFRDGSAKELLAAVLARYRGASSYRDDGRAQMTYQNDGRTETRVAPMSLWFDRNELYLATYDVRLTSDPESLTAWIADPSSDNFDSQVMQSTPLAGRPTATALLADPILSSRVAAGLAGPPPQLEWLFSPDSMKRLFEGDRRIEFGPTRTIDNRQCRCVIVDADGERFQFWIDDRAALIRRIDLPAIFAPLAPGLPNQPISLSIELVGATFNAPDRAPEIDQLPPSPKLLRRFVPLPPPRPSRVLGTRLPNYSPPSGAGKVTLLMHSSGDPNVGDPNIGDPNSDESFAMVGRWFASLPDERRHDIRLEVLGQRDAELAKSISLAPGELMLVDGDGVVAWIDPGFTAASMPDFVAVLSDVLSGVDVPERLKRQWSDDFAAYQNACREASLSRN